jgi:hypothetical protein
VGKDGTGARVRPLAPSRVNACNPLLQAHPTWARDKHEGRGISTSHARLSPAASPFALRLAPTYLGWGTWRQFTRRSRDPPVSKRRQYRIDRTDNEFVKWEIRCLLLLVLRARDVSSRRDGSIIFLYKYFI